MTGLRIRLRGIPVVFLTANGRLSMSHTHTHKYNHLTGNVQYFYRPDVLPDYQPTVSKQEAVTVTVTKSTIHLCSIHHNHNIVQCSSRKQICTQCISSFNSEIKVSFRCMKTELCRADPSFYEVNLRLH